MMYSSNAKATEQKSKHLQQQNQNLIINCNQNNRNNEMTKIKIVNQANNHNTSLSTVTKNNHNNASQNQPSNNTQNSSSIHTSNTKHTTIVSTNSFSNNNNNNNNNMVKNSMLHRQQSFDNKTSKTQKKTVNDKQNLPTQYEMMPTHQQQIQTSSVRSIDSIIELEIIDNEKLSLGSSIEEIEYENDDSSEDFSLEKSNNDDLVHLNNLNEATVLENLKKRFCKNQIYTFIGDILIAMNPLKAISIYGKKVSNYYKSCENIRAKLPPHIYATAEQCYREMIRTQQAQCILISGESGSGKTETCKYLVQHLLNRTKPFESCLNAKIQEVNPLLEAFGNAKTRINDNSSRFGKYLEIYFEQDGTVVGAKFKEYLLEKSRVVYQNEYESTFHIFYLLFAGLTAEEKLRYGLLRSPKKFRFLSNTNVDSCMSVENEEKFFAIKKSLNTIGFVNEDIENLIKVLINVLFIGEIQFSQKKGNNNDAVQVKNKEIIKNICDLLEMDPSELNEALISDVQITRGEEIKRERNMVQACDVRDALAKAFYGRLFSWIVNQINHHIQPAEGIGLSYSIGLLDIFGFENFEKNSFEQMCINLANEQLHQLFTKYIFKLEIQECLDEQIELSNSDLVNYQDNQIILDLFLEKRAGIFPLLDEESRFPKATDQSLAIKLHQTLSPAYPDVYIAPKNVGTSFHIVHYAGQVLYNCEGFLEKNRDFLPNNLFYAARNSNNFLVQELFQCKLTRKGTIAPSDRQSRLRKSITSFKEGAHNSSGNSDGHNEIYMTRFKFSGANSSSSSSSNVYVNKEDFKNSVSSHFNNYSSDKALPLTVASHFKNSLHELIEKINKCKAYFIRCIKPNPNQENVFLNEFVIKQLRYCSLMHVCKIRKCGYPYRIKFDEFLKWYKAIEICICKTSNSNEDNNVDENLQKCLKCLEYAKITNYKVGKTKLFLRYWHIDIFNSLAKKLEKNVIITQKIIRGWLVRSNLKKIQQNEAKKFLNQIQNRSENFHNKLDKHRSFYLALNQQNKSSDEETSGESSKSVSPLNKKAKMINSKSTNFVQNDKNWPDMNEINHTLEEFDTMLDAYDTNMEHKENKSRIYVYQPNPQIKNSQLTRSSSSFNAQNITNKISPTSVYHLVHNNNNKNDNTLKKRNALVAFEFKTLLDKVTPHSHSSQIQYPGCLVIEEDRSLQDDLSHALPSPPYVYNDDHFEANQNYSPPSYSSSSSATSSSSSASNSSDSSDHERTVSPSQLTRNARYLSPPSKANQNNKQNVHTNYLLTELNNTDNDTRRNINQIRPKTQIVPMIKVVDSHNPHLILSERELLNKTNLAHGHIVSDSKNYMNKHQFLQQHQVNHHPQPNVTIWREELNAKNNVQEQIKKQTELCQKLEDSKKNIPEWKKNLIKQKEMKRITSNNHHGSSTNLTQIPETPELMKHNIFIKKGLAAQK